jgi:hypothetical protein
MKITYQDGVVEISQFFEEGGFIIRSNEDGFDVFEVPQYGGSERFEGSKRSLVEALELGLGWT